MTIVCSVHGNTLCYQGQEHKLIFQKLTVKTRMYFQFNESESIILSFQAMLAIFFIASLQKKKPKMQSFLVLLLLYHIDVTKDILTSRDKKVNRLVNSSAKVMLPSTSSYLLRASCFFCSTFSPCFSRFW